MFKRAFDESKVHRGQPENAGEFAPKEGGQATQKASKSAALAMAEARYDPASKSWSVSGQPLPKLRIPPAWQQVRVSTDPKATILATGYDVKGRKQTVYSAEHSMRAAAAKFGRISELHAKVEQIIQENKANLSRGDDATKEAASVTALIFSTGLRPGSNRDTKAEKQAYGATTLRTEHVVQTADGVRLQFTGKKGVSLDLPVNDPDTAQMVLDRAKRAGPEGRLFNVSDTQLRDYVHTLDGGNFKPKDFRTLLGTRMAAQHVAADKGAPPKNEKEYKARVKEVAKKVSAVLGNTPTIALQSYIDPTVFSKWRAA